jgi:hypothetical protein
MTNRRCLHVLSALLLTCTELLAKGGTYRTEDRYNPQHIDNLPPEIRSSILRLCKEPRALHPFAHYSDGAKRIELHFEHFVCDGDASYCPPSGCLHQIWILVHGRYRLMRSFHAPAGDQIGPWQVERCDIGTARTLIQINVRFRLNCRN